MMIMMMIIKILYLVEFENRELDLLLLVLGLLGGGVILLLPLLGSTSQAKHQVEGGLLLDVVVREGTSIFQLLTSEDQSLLIWGDSCKTMDTLH